MPSPSWSAGGDAGFSPAIKSVGTRAPQSPVRSRVSLIVRRVTTSRGKAPADLSTASYAALDACNVTGTCSPEVNLGLVSARKVSGALAFAHGWLGTLMYYAVMLRDPMAGYFGS